MPEAFTLYDMQRRLEKAFSSTQVFTLRVYEENTRYIGADDLRRSEWLKIFDFLRSFYYNHHNHNLNNNNNSSNNSSRNDLLSNLNTLCSFLVQVFSFESPHLIRHTTATDLYCTHILVLFIFIYIAAINRVYYFRLALYWTTRTTNYTTRNNSDRELFLRRSPIFFSESLDNDPLFFTVQCFRSHCEWQTLGKAVIYQLDA